MKDVKLFHGDCREVLSTRVKENSINLIITSPPYANQRKGTYGGIHPDSYVEWFLPIAQEMLRVLKSDGSFVLNIKENAVNKELHPYVMELVLAMRRQGWKLIEEYMWHKTNSFPGKWSTRFSNKWEHLYHFAKTTDFYMNQDAVKVPIGDWAKSRLKNLSAKDMTRQNSEVGSGFGKNISNWVGKEMVYPSNVLTFATECGNKGHSAAFPKQLPIWFIKLFSRPNDIILDPFVGSGTSLFAAHELGRKSIGIELNEEYYQQLKEKVENA